MTAMPLKTIIGFCSNQNHVWQREKIMQWHSLLHFFPRSKQHFTSSLGKMSMSFQTLKWECVTISF